MLVDIEDGSDDDLGVGLAAPLPNLLDGDRGPGVRAPGDVVLPTDRGVGQVDVEYDGAGRWFRGSLRSHLNRRSHFLAVQLERPLSPSDLAGRDRAAYVEGLLAP
ncbi:hypothetical protein [Nocardioides salsibiostraticola]